MTFPDQSKYDRAMMKGKTMAGFETRALTHADRGRLADFFDRHRDTSLFLRGNLALAGLGASAHPFGGDWVGAFEGPSLAAVAAHFNGGNVVVAGTNGVEAAAGLAVAMSKRPVRGVVGPWLQATSVLAALELGAEPSLVSKEVLYGIDLSELRTPADLETGRVSCRHSKQGELDALTDWRVAFEMESLSKAGDSRQRAAAFVSIETAHTGGRLFVLDDARGRAVASSAFNARADGIVQVGGVFTPPELRGRRHGRAVVAGSLLDAARHGAHRSVLFTGESNRAARRAYEALGYRVVGDYGLLLF